MSEKVRLAIIGTGRVANSHVRGHKRNPDVEIVAVADIVPGKAAEFAARHGFTDTRICGSYEEVCALEDVDAVDICTRHEAHAPASLAALAAGKHVFCEKPFASSVAEAAQMCEMAKGSGLVHMVDFTYRYYGMAHLVRQLIDGGQLGEILRVRTQYLMTSTTRRDASRDLGQPSASVLGGLGAHMIDLARFFGGEIVSVKGYHGLTPEGGESGSAIIQFASGAVGSVESSSMAIGFHLDWRAAEVYGTKGAALLNYYRPSSIQLLLSEGVCQMVPGGFVTVSVPNLDPEDEMMESRHPELSGWIHGLARASRIFSKAIQDGSAEYLADFYDGYRSQVIIEAISESSSSGCEIGVRPE